MKPSWTGYINADRYDFFASFTSRYAEYALEKAIPMDLTNPTLVLDVAAGTGAFSLTAARKFPLSQVVATDINPHMLHVLQRKVKTLGLINVRIKEMDGQNLDEIVDNSVDLAASFFGLVFFDDRVQGFREIHRVLKPEGSAIIASYVKAGISHPLFKELRGNKPPSELELATTSLDSMEKIQKECNQAATWSSIECQTKEMLWNFCNLEEMDQVVECFLANPVFQSMFMDLSIDQQRALLREKISSMATEEGQIIIPFTAMITTLTK